MDYLQEIEAIPRSINCDRCQDPMTLQIYRARGNETIIYRCHICQKRVSIFSKCIMRGSHLKCTDVMFLIMVIA